MTRPSPNARLAYVLAALILVLDQLSKWWVVDVIDLPHRAQIAVLPPLFKLTFVANFGVSFGFLRADTDVGRWGLFIFSGLIAAGFAWYARKLDRLLPAIAVGLVIGGAIGNMIDRARIGYVIDFLDFNGLFFPWVFNVADSGITVGMMLLVLDSLTHKDEPKTA
jgi:signal peptidase II